MAAMLPALLLALGVASGPAPMPDVPADLPSWMSDASRDKIFHRRGPYNFDVYNLPPLARDLNAVAVGHAMAYEDLVTGRAGTLETATFERIDWVLKHPPRFMPDEAVISPTFGRRYGSLEQVFDWAHLLHAQTVDVLASTRMTLAEKEREIEALFRFYQEGAPYVITPLPMNMEFLDTQSYSKAFRRKYPKVNGLFWGYHWLQGAMYDVLYGQSLGQQRRAYEVLGERYRSVELYRIDRAFMPMHAEVSPRFAMRFPQIANIFDNLHMLHDLVNDILATAGMTDAERDGQVRRAIWLVLDSTHRGEKAGAMLSAGLHDHRHPEGMPGMGMMKAATEELMFMPGMGWMSMTDCGHCSMALPEGDDAWRAPTVTAEGWTMRVRCPLCARDMAAQVKGRAILRIPTEDRLRPLLLVSNERGELQADPELPRALFLEQEGGHAKCDLWSAAMTSREAFDRYLVDNPRYASSPPLTLQEWSERQGKDPDTYVKPKAPVEDPYADDAHGRRE